MIGYRLAIELKRVQAFIFDVPRLKTMLGANALIGQTMRHELSQRLNGRGRELSWPEGLKSGAPDDPLVPADGLDRDHPQALYTRGILARDGGHFIAVFESLETAKSFQKDAESCLAEHLPGLPYEIGITLFEEKDTREGRVEKAPEERHLLHLPSLQVCQETGCDPASEKWQTPDNDRWISRATQQRRHWGNEFHNQKTRDIIGLMRSALHPDAAMQWKEPIDIADLTSGDYLALIHADGNQVGQRFKQHQGRSDAQDRIAREAHGEAFFHSMRVTVRKAVVAALRKTFTQNGGVRPYEVLMLGGDDLLLVCRANRALDFALNYVRQLQGHDLTDGKRLDVAIGVAIAKKTYPLHRLHELAESLALSAKRLYRSLDDHEKQSVIDWQVVTQSWFDDVEAARSQSERIAYTVDEKSETLLLSARPYKVLCGHSLEHLLTTARSLRGSGHDDEEAARSALRSLRGACEQGRLSAEMAFKRLPDPVKAALGGKLWEETGSVHLTRALDIIGIYEIARLGRKRND